MRVREEPAEEGKPKGPPLKRDFRERPKPQVERTTSGTRQGRNASACALCFSVSVVPLYIKNNAGTTRKGENAKKGDLRRLTSKGGRIRAETRETPRRGLKTIFRAERGKRQRKDGRPNAEKVNRRENGDQGRPKAGETATPTRARLSLGPISTREKRGPDPKGRKPKAEQESATIIKTKKAKGQDLIRA